MVPNVQVAEQVSEQRKDHITPLLISIPKGTAKDNPNELPPKKSLGYKPYAQDNSTKETPLNYKTLRPCNSQKKGGRGLKNSAPPKKKSRQRKIHKKT